jgi:hypothetical protein
MRQVNGKRRESEKLKGMGWAGERERAREVINERERERVMGIKEERDI